MNQLKKAKWIIVGITSIFMCLLVGIFIGRNSVKGTYSVDYVLESKSQKSENHTVVEDGRIDLNSASLEQLQLLPGVGQSTAQQIIDYRLAHNGFTSIEELMNIKGIGEKKFEQIKQYIKIGGKYEDSGS